MSSKDSKNEDVSDDIPSLCEDDSDLDDEDLDGEDAGWEDAEMDEVNMLVGEVLDLFSTQLFSSVHSVLSHCSDFHGIDIVALCKLYSMDSISYIKLINFIRSEKPTPNEVKEAFKSGGDAWSNDDFMKAVDPSDLLLQFDIESATELSGSDAGVKETTECDRISALTLRLKKADEDQNMLKAELNRALEDIDKLRLSGQQLVMRMNTKEHGTKTESSGDASTSSSSKELLHEEDGYFASYSHHSIHSDMLKDKVRTESYRDFMLKNTHLFEGKKVLDVGCGTGILSMFAVKAGASHVVAVDQSNIIYQAMDIARENNMHEKITFVKGKLEEVNLPIEKFDVIVSEWMGYFLLFEAMLDSVLFARDRYLAPGGCVYPDQFTISLVGVNDPGMHDSKLKFWDDVYGFKMTCMKRSVVDEVYVKTVNSSTIVTDPAVIKAIDTHTCRVDDLEFEADFSLSCQQEGNITAVVGYFTTLFHTQCHNKISFSTGPEAKPTHWEQSVMFLPKPLNVVKGQCVKGSITYRKHPHDNRGIIITLTLGKQAIKYNLS